MFTISTQRPTSATQVRSLSETDVVTKSEPAATIQIEMNRQDGDPNRKTEFEQTVYETKKYHRLIEKRRRDRINECIFQLKDLLPTDVINSTTRSMEKAVILELVLQYMKSLERKKRQEKKEFEKLREQAFICGFRDCTEKMFKLIDDEFDDQQKQKIRNKLQEQTPFYITESPLNTKVSLGDMFLPDSKDSNNSIHPATSIKPEFEESQKLEESQPLSSASSLSGSSLSDLSLCAENSDSSGSGSMSGIQNKPLQKVLKRRMLHHRSASVPNQITAESKPPHTSPNEKRPKVKTPPPPISNSNVLNQVPIYINMPVMMNPGMVQASTVVNQNPQVSEVENATTQSQPTMISGVPATVMPQVDSNINSAVQFTSGPMITQMPGNVASGVPMQFTNGAVITQMGGNIVQSGVQLPNGSMIPQMASNGVQFPTFFMACGPQPIQQEQQAKQPQTVPVNPMVLQPTVMMPMRGQGNVICMPSFPVMQPFQTQSAVSGQP